MVKEDVEGRSREIYPMFDLDGFIRSIDPQNLTLQGRYMEVQFSDGWDGDLLYHAYDCFDENFTSCDWHNH